MKHPGKNSCRPCRNEETPSRAVKGRGVSLRLDDRSAALPRNTSDTLPELLFSGPRRSPLGGASTTSSIVSSTTSASAGATSSSAAADEQLHRRLDVAVQRDGHLVLAGRLDGVAPARCGRRSKRRRPSRP